MKKYIVIFLLFFGTHSYSEIANKIEITVNNRVGEETIKVYGDISIPSDYKNEDLNRILKNLYSTNFFDDVKVSIENGILKITVKEHPIINSINIAARYVFSVTLLTKPDPKIVQIGRIFFPEFFRI